MRRRSEVSWGLNFSVSELGLGAEFSWFVLEIAAPSAEELNAASLF
jgi:hypothetical protein